MNKRNAFIAVGILLIILFISAHTSLGSSKTEVASLKLEQMEELLVDVSSADIEIIKENRSNIYVEFETYQHGDKLRTNEGKVTKIETYSNRFFPFGFNKDYKLTIYLPTDYEEDLTLKLSAGSVKMEDFILANIDCHLSSGSLRFDHIQAENIALDLSSGDVDFKSVSTNQLTTDISSGDVTLTDFKGKIKGKSSSGKLSVVYSETMDDLNYSTSSGSIIIDYSKVRIDGDFKLSKSSGSIHTSLDFDNYKEKSGGNKITGTIGSGEYTVDLSISSGNIKLKR